MQSLLFDQSPYLILPCLIIAGLTAWFLYRGHHPWSKRVNQALLVFRFLSIFLLLILLLGPILKMAINETESPLLVILVDHSKSIKLQDSVFVKQLPQKINETKTQLEEEGYKVVVRNIEGKEGVKDFNFSSSDLNGAIRRVELEFEDRNLGGIILISDGIFNNGLSPLYASTSVPIHTVGVGDTTTRTDIRISQLSYNKVSYQGNRFPLKVEILATNVSPTQSPVKINIFSSGKRIQSQPISFSKGNQFQSVEFMLEAEKSGLIRYDVQIDPIDGELNRLNNKMSAVVEIVDSKKEILIISTAPHPDIKALRAVIEKNEHFQVSIHIPGVQEIPSISNQIEKTDVLILNQIPDQRNSSAKFLDQLMKLKIPTLVIVGQQSALRQLSKSGIPINFESVGQWDEVRGAPAISLDLYKLPEQATEILGRMPPLIVPFGKFSSSTSIQPILMQRIGNVLTDRPLLFVTQKDDHRLAILMGEGIWRWRMKEFQVSDKTSVFDELFSKLIQYLGTPEDKRKFRCFPVNPNFSINQPVLLEVQIFNDVFEMEYGRAIDLEIINEKGEKRNFNFTSQPSRTQFSINLPDGIYRYKAGMERNGKKEIDQGVFSVLPGDSESQDLTADFGLLRQLAKKSGGNFFNQGEWEKLSQMMIDKPMSSRVHSDESFYPLIDLAWIFFLILTILTTEWIIRKSEGGY